MSVFPLDSKFCCLLALFLDTRHVEINQKVQTLCSALGNTDAKNSGEIDVVLQDPSSVGQWQLQSLD